MPHMQHTPIHAQDAQTGPSLLDCVDHAQPWVADLEHSHTCKDAAMSEGKHASLILEAGESTNR